VQVSDGICTCTQRKGFFMARRIKSKFTFYDIESLLYSLADAVGDWTILKDHPRLLFKWQVVRRTDVHAIAAYASHILDRHTWCGEECEIMNPVQGRLV